MIQTTYGRSHWWIQVKRYYQVGGDGSGPRWRMCYDDTFIADFDHEPTMNECMDALIKWWKS